MRGRLTRGGLTICPVAVVVVELPQTSDPQKRKSSAWMTVELVTVCALVWIVFYSEQ